MNKDMVWGVVRAVLAAGGGYLISTGMLDESTVSASIGAIGILFAAGWSIWSKK